MFDPKVAKTWKKPPGGPLRTLASQPSTLLPRPSGNAAVEQARQLQGTMVHAVGLAVLVASVPACSKQPEPTVTVAHASNGLRLSLPESLPIHGLPQRVTVTPTDAGFEVSLGRGTVWRVPIETSVEVRGGVQPRGAWPSERKVGGRRIHYRVDRSEGGSGGTQIDFHAWEECLGGHLEYAQGDVVKEPGEPDFSLVWRVIAGTQPPR